MEEETKTPDEVEAGVHEGAVPGEAEQENVAAPEDVQGGIAAE